MKTRRLIAVSGVLLFGALVVYSVPWFAGFARLARGVSGVTIENDSDTPLRNVQIHLGFGDFGGATNRFDTIKPRERVRVATYKGDVYVWSVSFHQGKNSVTDEVPVRAKVGNILQMVVDSRGKVSYAR